MRIRVHGLFVTLLAVFASVASAETRQDTIHGVLDWFGNQIYVLGETTGGTPESWTQLEQQGIRRIALIASQSPHELTAQDEKGRTPLAIAAMRGYAPFVSKLLTYGAVRDDIESVGQDGLSAYDLALLANRQTLQACHPNANNPFILVPFWVTQPYYENRAPYHQITQVLRQAGANAEQQTAKKSWLSRCRHAHPEDRATIEASTHLLTSLLSVQARAEERAKRAELDEKADVLRELFAPRVKAGKMSEQDVENAVAQLYRRAGIDPENKEPDQ